MNKRSRANGEGTIYKNKQGTYTAQITTSEGRPSFTHASRSRVRAWLTQQQHDMDMGDYVNPSEMPLGVWWSRWVKVYKSKAVTDATRDTYRAARARLPQVLLDKPICQITHSDVQEAINGIKGKRRTAELTLTNLKMCLQRAVLDHMIRHNPCVGTELPPNDAEESVPLTQEEYDALVKLLTEPVRVTAAGKVDQNDQATQTIRDALYFILMTGVRREEACQIQWDDIVGNMMHIRGTKTDSSDRWIPIIPEVRAVINRRRFTKNSEWIFATRTGTPIEGRNVLRWLQGHMNHTVHDLRHTYCTRAAQAKINPKVLQQLTGHARIETLLKIYTHVSEQDKIDAAAEISVYCKSTANTVKNHEQSQ